jgi:hypothetical protein
VSPWLPAVLRRSPLHLARIWHSLTGGLDLFSRFLAARILPASPREPVEGVGRRPDSAVLVRSPKA